MGKIIGATTYLLPNNFFETQGRVQQGRTAKAENLVS